MGLRNSGSFFARAGVRGALLLLTTAPALAQPALIGLVIGSGNYSAFPALPACLASSQKVASALRGLGYQVTERQDVTSGGLAAAVSEFSTEMTASPGASAFVYFCGYAAGMNDRAFLLPVSANIRRPSDVMTQGILAKAILDVLDRSKPSRGLVTLDLVPVPDGSSPPLDTLMAVPAPAGTGLIAVSGSLPATGPTALSLALVKGLANPGVQSSALLAGVEAQLRGHPAVEIGALRMPSISQPLVADEQPPPALPVTTQPEPVGDEAAESRPPTAQKTVEVEALPDEDAMTVDERRRVQEALARLGYYAGEIDGLFGPETRAAIRRFQHELGVEMTGVITGAQAGRLLTRH